jgi:outer membrane protein assembly factor BamB
VPLNLNCETAAFAPVERRAGGGGGGAVRGRINHFHPQAPDRLGEFRALDLRTGETLWQQRLRVPYNTAALTTGGGLAFIGDWGRRVHAYDARTGETLWQQRLRVPYNTAALTTGGGLAFIGDWGRRVHAYDARTGETLWQSRLPTMANGFPITYAVDGRQFVAFVAGPSISRSSWATLLPADLIPEEHNPRGGSGVFVFALP